ncbi:hypothetical protein NHG23_02755 [Aerococcaceae bacterium NML190073]|nr:hypothetical protein [Aerococcaceae bacterium NML190073]
MEKMKLSRDEYDAVVEKYREQNGYDDMSDDEKAHLMKNWIKLSSVQMTKTKQIQVKRQILRLKQHPIVINYVKS